MHAPHRTSRQIRLLWGPISIANYRDAHIRRRGGGYTQDPVDAGLMLPVASGRLGGHLPFVPKDEREIYQPKWPKLARARRHGHREERETIYVLELSKSILRQHTTSAPFVLFAFVPHAHCPIVTHIYILEFFFIVLYFLGGKSPQGPNQFLL